MWFVLLAIVLLAWWRKRRVDAKAAASAAAASPAAEPEAPERARERPAADVRRRRKRPVAATSTLAAVYAGFSAWTFVAWYRKHAPLSEYKWGGDGWLGVETYAGGADKFGHAWATMTLARLGTYILSDWGGFSRRKVSVLSATLSELLFTGVEVKDGVYYEFSFSDLTGDSTGAVLALLLDNFPALARAFAFRVEYSPSEMYSRKVAGESPCAANCSRWNIAEDYSGQTYLAALHLSAIRAIRDKLGDVSRFVDVAIGFGSRNYKPNPDHDITDRPRQDLSLRLGLNAQGIGDYFLEDRRSAAAQMTKTIIHALFEVFSMPYGSIALATLSREKPLPAWAQPKPASRRLPRGRARATPAPRRR
jgi:hypothetical protein